MKIIITLLFVLGSFFTFGQKKEAETTKKDSVVMTELQKTEFAEINKLHADLDEAYKKAKQEIQQRQNHSLMLILDAKGFKIDAIVPSSLNFKDNKILFNTKTK